jgi:hypothetical protein
LAAVAGGRILRPIGRREKSDSQRKDQGDQIGRIFAYWVIVFFGQFFLITAVLGYFFPQLRFEIFWQKWAIFLKLIWSPWKRFKQGLWG